MSATMSFGIQRIDRKDFQVLPVRGSMGNRECAKLESGADAGPAAAAIQRRFDRQFDAAHEPSKPAHPGTAFDSQPGCLRTESRL